MESLSYERGDAGGNAMILSEHQQAFAQDFARLILRIAEKGCACTIGEVLRTQEMADLYAKQGKGIRNSMHLKKLAGDINLFVDGKYVADTEPHRPFGEYWESLDLLNRWGGRYSDANHYERMETPWR